MKTKTHYRKLNSYKYQLVKEFKYQTNMVGYDIKEPYIQLNQDGLLTVSKSYAWDGASGPTIDTLNSMRASLVHDALYQLLRLSFLPQDQVIVADKLFKNILIEDGMSKFRAWYWYQGLRLANGKAAKQGTQKPEVFFIAPNDKS